MDTTKMNQPVVFRRVLLAVDEDDQRSSARAFRYATTLARDYDVELGIVSVMESEDMNIFDSLTPSKMQEHRDRVQEIVGEYVKAAEEGGIKKVTPLVYEGGDVDDMILEQVIPDFKPDLIIAGADSDPSHHQVTAPVGIRLARRAPVSVIVVR